MEMILRAEAPDEEELEDEGYKLNNLDFFKYINKQQIFMDLFMLDSY